MTDKYDEAIEYLTANPLRIYDAWNRPMTDPGGCLFQSAGPPGCSCLTQIRRWEDDFAATKELTAAIRSDDRIPINEYEIEVEHLPVFAEWQRKIDALGIR